METQLVILGFVGLIIVVIIGIEINNRRNLKVMVKNNWGKFPHSIRFDKEESLKKAWFEAKKYRKYDSEVDDITWYDLDGFTLFERINATYSSAGSEALYQQLRNYNFSTSHHQRLEKLIDYYEENPTIREKIQYHFACLGKKDNNMVEEYLNESKQQKLPNVLFFVLCGCLPIALLLLFLVFPNTVFVFLLLASVLFNTIYYQIKKEKLNRELACMGYLVQTVSAAKKIAKITFPFQKELQENLQAIESITKFGISFRMKSNSEAELIFEYLSMMLMLPFISYNFVLSKLTNHEKKAKEVWRLLGELEVASAVLNYRTVMPNTSQPIFSQERMVKGKEVYHPLLTTPVSNNVDWNQNTLVTGSNASGKSTYVRSIAISCILSMTINTALAKRFQLPYAHVLTSMAVEDDIFEGDSYFVAEIKSVKRILDIVEIKATCLCFIDEILKGTNTIERISASSSIVYWLNQFPTLAFVATHDIELTEILKDCCNNVHFEEQVTPENGVSFDYQLRQGPSTTRNALQLLNVLNYPEEIVTLAKTEARHFDEHRSWQQVKGHTE